ncbi:MAG: hypothetical protein K0041_09520, partial [Acidithiobacillus sp.]|nr:hypothetical protein [Acidithiobacillus sp.]
EDTVVPVSWLQKKQPSFNPEQFLTALQELRGLIEDRTNALSEELEAIRNDVSTLMTSDEEEYEVITSSKKYVDDELDWFDVTESAKPEPTKPEPAKAEPAKPDPAKDTDPVKQAPDLGIPAYRDPWFALLVSGAAMLCALAVGVGYGYMLSDKHLPFWGWQVLSAPSGLLLFPLAGAVLFWHGRALHKTDEKQAGKYQKSGIALVILGLLLAVAAFFV